MGVPLTMQRATDAPIVVQLIQRHKPNESHKLPLFLPLRQPLNGLFQIPFAGLDVTFGRVQRTVTEQARYHVDAFAAVDQIPGKSVTEHMRGQASWFNIGLVRKALEHALDRAGGQRGVALPFRGHPE